MAAFFACSSGVLHALNIIDCTDGCCAVLLVLLTPGCWLARFVVFPTGQKTR